MQLEVFLPWFLAKVVGTTPTADPKGRKERCCLRRRSDTSTLINVKDLGSNRSHNRSRLSPTSDNLARRASRVRELDRNVPQASQDYQDARGSAIDPWHRVPFDRAD